MIIFKNTKYKAKKMSTNRLKAKVSEIAHLLYCQIIIFSIVL
jgi:hypothetical protein